jgi:hypothetical protein
MMTDRHRYRHEVDRLLGAIGERVSELQRLRERGVRAPGLVDRESELARMRSRLAALISQGTDPSGQIALRR